jgi:hypothetical protein
MKRSRTIWQGALAAASLAAALFFGATPASASGTHASENLIMSTGFVDAQVEMVVCLDIVSGTLTGYVINPNTRKFFATYTTRAVTTDLGVAKGKNPKYAMVTGVAQFKPGAGGQRLGGCVVYITEETSGNMVAYAVPWDPGAVGTARPINAQFVKLGAVKVGSGGPRTGAAAAAEGK